MRREDWWARDNMAWDAYCSRDNFVLKSSSSSLSKTCDITSTNFFQSFLLVMEAKWTWNQLFWNNT